MAWCPIGYVCIPQIYDACDAAAAQLLRGITDFQSIAGTSPFERLRDEMDEENVSKDADEESASKDTDEENASEDTDEENASKDTDEDIKRDEAYFSVQGAILNEFLRENRNKALACSPDGKLFRISGFLLDPPLFNHWFQISKEHGNRPELRYIDVYTGLFDFKNSETRLQKWWGWDTSPPWLDEYKVQFSHLEGWSVCFPEADVDFRVESLMNLWDPLRKIEISSVGRPRKQEAVNAAYRRAFPKGHGNMSYKQVLETLERLHGVSASTYTLQRALGLRK